MSADAWITLAVVLATLVLLATDRVPPAAAVLGATVLLLVLGVTDEAAAFSGFSNPAPLTVAALYVLARGAEKTGLLGPVVTRLLGARVAGRRTLVRLLVPAASASAFLNNTPLVAMLIPEVTTWSAGKRVSPSRFLLPLSYAAILGGTVTVLGTSTNLVVSGLLDASGQEPLALFELAPIGGLSAAAGLALLILLAPVLVPERRGAAELLTDEMREFVVQMEVEPGGRMDGVDVAAARLRNLEGVYLVEVERDAQVIAPVAPTTVLEGGDRLRFAGRADLVVDLQRMRGLKSSEDEHLLAVDSLRHTFFEAVVGAQSPLVNRTLRDVEFRARYQAAVLAIHRAGQRIEAKLGQVRIEAGDTLLLLAGPDFRTRWRDRHDFLLVARLGGPPPSSSRKAPIVGAVALAVVGLAAFEVLPILQAALLAAATLVLTRVLTVSEARDSVDLNVVVLIAAAFGLGAAIETTGLAETIARGLVDLLAPLGAFGIVLGVVLATTVLTEVITNNAAAVVLFPIVIQVATAAGLDARTLAIAVAVAASSSFLTPMGYQTNTMVYGPGGYRFADYLRAGIPLNLTVVTVISTVTWTLAT